VRHPGDRERRHECGTQSDADPDPVGPASVYRASIGLPGQHWFTGPASVYRASIGLPGQHRFTGPASVYRASIGLPGQHRFTGPASVYRTRIQGLAVWIWIHTGTLSISITCKAELFQYYFCISTIIIFTPLKRKIKHCRIMVHSYE
jgi:hypothetical protein